MHSVPANNMLVSLIYSPGQKQLFLIGIDSPVNIPSFTMHSPESKRRSAGSLVSGKMVMMSPGTNSREEM